jgi:predicted enzyme related to lactoylglutathione lyase
MRNAIAWFEIPCSQLDRSQAFYEAALQCKMRCESMDPPEGAVFEYEPQNEGAGGALVYLDASPSLDPARGGAGASHTAHPLPRRQ